MEYLELSQFLSDKDGNDMDPSEAGMPPDFPKEVRIRLTFERADGKTELTRTERDWPPGEMRDLSEHGVRQSLDKLAGALVRHRRAAR